MSIATKRVKRIEKFSTCKKKEGISMSTTTPLKFSLTCSLILQLN